MKNLLNLKIKNEQPSQTLSELFNKKVGNDSLLSCIRIKHFSQEEFLELGSEGILVPEGFTYYSSFFSNEKTSKEYETRPLRGTFITIDDKDIKDKGWKRVKWRIMEAHKSFLTTPTLQRSCSFKINNKQFHLSIENDGPTQKCLFLRLEGDEELGLGCYLTVGNKSTIYALQPDLKKGKGTLSKEIDPLTLNNQIRVDKTLEINFFVPI